MLKKRLKSIVSIALILISSASFAQSDANWEKAVQVWESSKNLKADYCVKSVVASAKGYSSDYNTKGGSMEGGMIHLDNVGKFQINVVKFYNKGEEYLVEGGKASKDSFQSVMNTKEHLVFSKSRQKYLTIEKKENENLEISKYRVTAKFPKYGEFVVTVLINTETGSPIKVINLKAASGKTAKGEKRLTLTYKNQNGNVVVKKRLEEAKIEFFGNASYMSDLFEFSNYK